jgi:uncharacterized protein YjbJ (UPF0337 family)
MALAKKSVKKTANAKAHAKNGAQAAKGKVKTATGKATGNKKLEVKGQLDKARYLLKSGHVRQTCTTHAKSSRSGVLHSSSPYIVRQSDFDMI